MFWNLTNRWQLTNYFLLLPKRSSCFRVGPWDSVCICRIDLLPLISRLMSGRVCITVIIISQCIRFPRPCIVCLYYFLFFASGAALQFFPLAGLIFPLLVLGLPLNFLIRSLSENYCLADNPHQILFTAQLT